MPSISQASADQTPVVIAVRALDLAVSLEMFIQALGRPVTIHNPERGLGALPLDPQTTLIIDRELIEGDPRRFIRRLRGQLWTGLPILLLEDGAAPEERFDAEDGVSLIEKPFVTSQLLATLRAADRRAA
jgi:DNA-binding response OmpR family regulator